VFYYSVIVASSWKLSCAIAMPYLSYFTVVLDADEHQMKCRDV